MPKSANLKAVFQFDGGFLHPERCNEAHVQQACLHGAHLQENETVTNVEFRKGGDEVVVRTNSGAEYVSAQVVLSPGPWFTDLVRSSPALLQVPALNKIASILEPQRNVVTWYRSYVPQLYATEVFPVFVLDYQNSVFYGNFYNI